MDNYLWDNDLSIDMIYSLHKLVHIRTGEDTFIFTDIFSIKFELIAKKFIKLN